MDKKRAVSIGVAIFLGLGAVSWVLFFGGKKEMEIRQETPAQNEETVGEQVIIESLADENVRRDGIIEKTPQQIVEEYKEEQKKPTETVIKPEKITEKSEVKKDYVSDIVERPVSFGFKKVSGERKLDTVIIHSSFNSLGGDQYDVEKIIAIYKSYGVAAHYIIGRDGTVYRLVKENDIAYHAGVSQVSDGRTNVNNFSIGIEMVGNYDDGYEQVQYDAINMLVKDMKARYDIKYVLGHKDIAPGRKTDPWGFDWNRISK